jgi:hypothetical protein
MGTRILITLETEVNPFFPEAILCAAGKDALIVSTPTAFAVL